MKRMKFLFGQRRMQVLLTLAVLLLAASVVIGSGANFTATSANSRNLFTAGNLTMSNSNKNALILAAGPMMPSDSTDGKVTVGNTGDGSADFWLTMGAPVNVINLPGTAALSGALHLNIVETATPANVIYDGPLSAFPAAGKNCGPFAAGASTQYTFTVTFPDSDFGSSPATRGSDNKYKNCSTKVEFDWEAVSN